MTEAAHRITAEHLAERVPETETGDELDRLAKTFNEMLGRLDVPSIRSVSSVPTLPMSFRPTHHSEGGIGSGPAARREALRNIRRS